MQQQRGAFLLETLFTMAIISLTMIILGRVLIFAYFHSKQSDQRLQFQQLLGYFQTYIQNGPYDSPLLDMGNHVQNEGEANISWLVEEELPDLKKIQLVLRWKQLKLKVLFYKSKYFSGEGQQ